MESPPVQDSPRVNPDAEPHVHSGTTVLGHPLRTVEELKLRRGEPTQSWS